MKITINNLQNQTNALIRSIEREEDKLALARLNTIRQQSYGKLRRARERFERDMPTGIDYQIQKAQIRQAEIEYNQIKQAVETLREYIKKPEDFTYKNRANYAELRKSLQRINLTEERRNAEKELVKQAQKQAGTVVGVSMYSIRKSQKIRALFENILFNNSEYNFNESDFNQIVRDVKALTGYDIEKAFMEKHFDTPQHYESGGGGSNIALFDKLVEISDKLKESLRTFPISTENEEEYKLLETRINDFLKMARLG